MRQQEPGLLNSPERIEASYVAINLAWFQGVNLVLKISEQVRDFLMLKYHALCGEGLRRSKKE